MSKGILTVTVNPAVDVTVTPKTAPGRPGAVGAFTLDLSAGGKGVNVARVLRSLGVRVLAGGIAGGQTGNFLQKLLRAENIPAVFVRVEGPTRLNVTALGPRSGSRERVIQEGPQLTPKEIQRFEIRYRQWLRRSRWVVLAGRNAAGAPVDWYARLVRLARREGVPAAVDTSGAALAAALKAKPFLIKPNRAEAEAILHRRLDSPAQIKKALRHFHDRGVAVVLLSLGGRGAVASDGKSIWYARPPLAAFGEPRPAPPKAPAEAGLRRASLAASGPPRVRGVNDVGCGDALLAGFLATFEEKSLAEALRRGVACGTANTLNSVPGSVDPRQVRQLEKKVTLRSLGKISR